ncbi:MAG: Ldh family oxidoreductase [Candidatus Hydrogenedentes bacterium]|nr:Ldh family oxidoreductase [Candidatus Hydrogenedentota bacterium]
MKTVRHDELRSLVAGMFHNGGLSDRDSGIMADSLVHANLRGTDSHGVMRAPHYMQRLRMGSINPKPNTRFERTGPATATVFGDHGFGHVTNWDAMGWAIDMAKESGMALIGVAESNHCGALSFFASRAIEAELIGVAFTQTDKGVVPFGGRVPFCGTNPLCFGIPSASGPPVMLDMATSTVAGGHIYKARVENRPIPSTWALDKDSQPTTDPHAAAYWTPMAGAKGFGLGVIIDILTGILSGGAYGPHIPIMYGDYEKKRNLCHLIGALDFRRFAGSDSFLGQVGAMVRDLHAAPAKEGVEQVLAPGGPEYLRTLERERNGIPIDDSTWDELQQLAMA